MDGLEEDGRARGEEGGEEEGEGGEGGKADVDQVSEAGRGAEVEAFSEEVREAENASRMSAYERGRWHEWSDVHGRRVVERHLLESERGDEGHRSEQIMARLEQVHCPQRQTEHERVVPKRTTNCQREGTMAHDRSTARQAY